MKSEGVDDEEILGDDEETTGEVATPKSSLTGGHKRRQSLHSETGLSGPTKKKSNLASKQGLMASHEQDVARMVTIDFQQNPKIDLPVTMD